ncbi:MAG: hypothetical protein HY320_12605 [Armatimonadetes bacterium]|nr:hypothetical protein [Armatimonadota bacterium]
MGSGERRALKAIIFTLLAGLLLLLFPRVAADIIMPPRLDEDDAVLFTRCLGALLTLIGLGCVVYVLTHR